MVPHTDCGSRRAATCGDIAAAPCFPDEVALRNGQCRPLEQSGDLGLDPPEYTHRCIHTAGTP